MFMLFMKVLKDPKTNLMLTDTMLENIVKSLPSSKYYLENLLVLDELLFIKIIEKITKNEKNMETLSSPDRLEEYTLGYEFREFIHKIAYRLLNI